MHPPQQLLKFDGPNTRPSHNYCGICGHIPKTTDEPNRAPLRWWSPDDGWRIGTLCRFCADIFSTIRPHPDQRLENVNTDEDPLLARQ